MTRTEPLLLPIFFALLLHFLIFVFLVSYANLGGDNDFSLPNDISELSIKAQIAVLPRPAPPKNRRPNAPSKPKIQEKPANKAIVQDKQTETAEQEQLNELIEQLDNSPGRPTTQNNLEESPLKPQDEAKLSAEKRNEALAYYKRNQDLVERNFNTGTAAQQVNFEGLVTKLKIYLDEEGRLLDVETISGSGNNIFDNEAEKAVRRIDKFIIPSDNALRRRYFREITMEFKLR